jgi:cupin 2 domain-containing protein
MDKGNLFEHLPEDCTTEVIETLFEHSGLEIERIVSEGQSTPPDEWYDQDWGEWVVLLQGSASIQFAGDKTSVVLKPGDYLSIPSHKKHRVEWTDRNEKTIWLVIHMKRSKK